MFWCQSSIAMILGPGKVDGIIARRKMCRDSCSSGVWGHFLRRCSQPRQASGSGTPPLGRRRWTHPRGFCAGETRREHGVVNVVVGHGGRNLRVNITAFRTGEIHHRMLGNSLETSTVTMWVYVTVVTWAHLSDDKELHDRVELEAKKSRGPLRRVTNSSTTRARRN